MKTAVSKSKVPLPVISTQTAPQSGRVTGQALEQVHILAAAPAPFRRLIATTSIGLSGVDLTFTSGIEVRFGDDREAARKWKAVAAVLADPAVRSLTYLSVQAPNRPALKGHAHELPPAS